jgi:two-component system, OmpR family, sensor kinase
VSRPLRRLQTRLLLWFLGAIVLAIAASVVTTFFTRSDPGETPTRLVSKHVQRRLAATWDDPVATQAYVDQLRDSTGLDMRLQRDPSVFPHTRRARGTTVFEDGVAYVPIVRRGVVVGALELRTGAPTPRLWRVGVALAAALLVLGVAARRVSKRLAKPLEHLAVTATRFGAGDLGARTGIENLPRRWVAEEVKDVGRAFDGMAERIERVVVEQRELLGAISHELRSPLARARVALEIARERTSGDPAATRPIDDADRQLVDMDAILGDLLASARAGLADLRLEELELLPWLRARITVPGERPIEIAVTDGAEEARVAIDSALVGRALHNVLANAWAHGHPADQPLEIEVSAGSSHARVVVRDRGTGFSSEVLARAFEPFVTGGDPARSPGAHGIGLGLALVRRIVEAHGGKTSARNRDPGPGAEVSLELPLAG